MKARSTSSPSPGASCTNRALARASLLCVCNRFAIGERRNRGLHLSLNVCGGIDINLMTAGNFDPDSVDDRVTQTIDANADVVCHGCRSSPVEMIRLELDHISRSPRGVALRRTAIPRVTTRPRPASLPRNDAAAVLRADVQC